jgi:hypothetical protein
VRIVCIAVGKSRPICLTCRFDLRQNQSELDEQLGWGTCHFARARRQLTHRVTLLLYTVPYLPYPLRYHATPLPRTGVARTTTGIISPVASG